MARGVPRNEVRHGTVPAYEWHKRRVEEPCDACRLAKSRADASWRAAGTVQRRNRLHARARNRALGRLARRHPVEFRALYLEEKNMQERGSAEERAT